MGKLEPEEQAFIKRLYIRYKEQLFNYAVIYLEPGSAEEAVQNTFLDACKKVAELEACPNPQAWLYRGLQFSIGKLKRSKQRLARYISYLPHKGDPQFNLRGIEELADRRPAEEDIELLYADLAQTGEFRLLKRFAVDDKSLRELAEEEGISISVCRQRLYRARQKLRRVFRDLDNDLADNADDN